MILRKSCYKQPLTQLIRGLAYQKIDQAQQAQADLERAIALTPQDSEDWQGRG